MSFDENELKQLTSAFWNDTDSSGDSTISFEEFRERILKYPGLSEKLSTSIMRCVAPHNNKKEDPNLNVTSHLQGYRRYFTSTFWRENKLLAGYISMFIIIQIVMIIWRIYAYWEFKKLDGSYPNICYILARATGLCLDVDNMILVFLVLRWGITKLRCMGIGTYFPLDNNIYLHKVVAYFVFLHATIHTLTHLLNFGILNNSL